MSKHGVIPPGRLGLFVLAAAMVPIAIKKFKPIVKRFGEEMVKAGNKVQKIAEEPDGYQKPEPKNVSKEARDMKEEVIKSTDMPDTKASSPAGHAEVDTQKSQADAVAPAPSKPKRKPRAPIKGTTPPAVNPKRARNPSTKK